ncbi:MAG: hypothetical protein ACKOPM_13470 [Novosphingobium sp.]
MRFPMVGAAALALLCAACGQSSQAPVTYEFREPASQAAADLAKIASSHSSLSRIDLQRPALAVQSQVHGDEGTVTIAIPGTAPNRDVTLRFELKPYLGGKETFVSFELDGPDLGELDLGPNRFAGRKSLSDEFEEALSLLSSRAGGNAGGQDPKREFERLFDLAAVLNDPAMLERVKSRSKQEGAVDFLFSNPPEVQQFDDSAD